jgi:hypothetical protein
MRRKRLQEFVNNLCPMFIGRLRQRDLETLAELQDGTIEINLLDSSTQHSHAGSLSLQVTNELKAWLHNRLNESNVPVSAITVAKLEVQINTQRVATDHKRIILFEFHLQSVLSTDEAIYSNERQIGLKWHNRVNLGISE